LELVLPVFQQGSCQLRDCGVLRGAKGAERQTLAGGRQIAGGGLKIACRLPFFAVEETRVPWNCPT